MKRTRIVGICLVAMFAMSAMIATAAHAGEYGECVKQSKPYKGNWTDKNCQITSPGKEGKYEWSPGVIAGNAALVAKTKSAELVGAAGTIACKKSLVAGKITGLKTNTEQVKFEGCEFKGAVTGECHSAGQPAGIILTNQLKSTLIDHGEKGASNGEPAVGEVWNQLAAEPGLEGVQAQFLCASIVEIKTKGTVSGVFTSGSVNVMAKKAEIEFNGKLGEVPGKFGEQDLASEASVGGGPFEPAGQAVEKTSAKIKQAGKIEIRA
jgi:hypothetical protein